MGRNTVVSDDRTRRPLGARTAGNKRDDLIAESPASQAAVLDDYIADRYHFGCTPEGDTFAVPRYGPRLPIMLRTGERLRNDIAAALLERDRRTPRMQAISDALAIHDAKARRCKPTTLHLRSAFVQTPAGAMVIVDLGESDSSRCLVATTEGWASHDAPPDGVLFRRTPAMRPIPDPQGKDDIRYLRDVLGFADDDYRWALVRGWLVASIFPEIQRPILVFLGAPGTAKTDRARCVVSVLDPRDELGSNFGKNIDDDQVHAENRFFVSYDNLAPSISEDRSDHICRLVTGEESYSRQLFTNKGLSVMSYRRTGVMTAITMPAFRPDAQERLIVIPLETIPSTQRRSGREIREAFAEAHPYALGYVMDSICDVLARLPRVHADNHPRPRMADYYDVLRALDTDDDGASTAAAYVCATKSTMAEAAEADPFVATVVAWLAEEGGAWSGSPSEAWKCADRHRRRDGGWSESWWPSVPARFTAALDRATAPLRAVGVTFIVRRSNGKRLITFATATTTDGTP